MRAPHSLARNTVAQSASRLLAYLLSFASAPIIVQGLGLRNFGIWALTGALAQYAGLLDLGVGMALGRYIATEHDNRRRCGQFMAVGWISVAVITLLLAGASLPSADLLSNTLHGVSQGVMRTVLLSSVALLGCTLLTSVISAYPIGHRRMVVPNVALAIGSVINFVASVGCIALGAGLPGYAVANAIAGVISVIVMVVIVVRAEGRLPLARPDFALIRELVSYSSKSQIVRLMDLVNYQTDKVIIAFAVGPAAAGAYDLANRVAIAARQFGVYATSAADIELASLITRFGLDRARQRYGRFTEIAAIFGFPPVLLVIASAPLLLDAWLKHSPSLALPVLVALCGAYLIAVSTGVGYGMSRAAGEPGLVARTSVATALANIVLTSILGPIFGIWGVLSGTVVALSAGAIVQVIYIHRHYHLPAAVYLDAVGPALRTYALLAVPVAIVSYSHVVAGRGPTAVAVVVLGAGYALACLTWASRTGRLPSAVSDRLRRIPLVRPALSRETPGSRACVSAEPPSRPLGPARPATDDRKSSAVGARE